MKDHTLIKEWELKQSFDLLMEHYRKVNKDSQDLFLGSTLHDLETYIFVKMNGLHEYNGFKKYKNLYKNVNNSIT
jgi:hypothetical protein